MTTDPIEGDLPGRQNNRRDWCITCLMLGSSAFVGVPVSAQTTRTLRIVDGALSPYQRLVKVFQGDRLHWRITSNAPGALHLHAYRLSIELQAGQPQVLAFTAFATGRFRLEWHPAGASGRLFTAQHAPALAMLEVQPR